MPVEIKVYRLKFVQARFIRFFRFSGSILPLRTVFVFIGIFCIDLFYVHKFISLDVHIVVTYILLQSYFSRIKIALDFAKI